MAVDWGLSTIEMMMASFSRPWKPSTELISTAARDCGRSCFSRCTCRHQNSFLTLSRYGHGHV